VRPSSPEAPTRASRLLKADASPPGCDGHAREKNAGSVNSSAVCATEDVLSRRPAQRAPGSGGRGFAFQQPPGRGSGSNALAGALAGFGAIVLFALFGLIAYLLYPYAYDPVHNMISDLGNPLANPSGALSFQLGVIIVSVLTLVFSASLGVLTRTQSRGTVALLRLGQAAGIFCGLDFMFVGVFPLGLHSQLHGLFADILWFGLFFFEIFFAVALLRIRGVPRWIPCLGFFAASVDVTSGLVIRAGYMEWATVAFVLAFIGAIAQLLWQSRMTYRQPVRPGSRLTGRLRQSRESN
jgi:hypothetical membrane protein